MMKLNPQTRTELLVDRLAHALSGTMGRTISVDSTRNLVALEVAEWNYETCQQKSCARTTDALIVGPSELFC